MKIETVVPSLLIVINIAFYHLKLVMEFYERRINGVCVFGEVVCVSWLLNQLLDKNVMIKSIKTYPFMFLILRNQPKHPTSVSFSY